MKYLDLTALTLHIANSNKKIPSSLSSYHLPYMSPESIQAF